MQPRDAIELRLALFRQRHFHPPPVESADATRDPRGGLAARDQRDHAVMLGLQPLGELADRRKAPPREALDLQEQLVLQWRHAMRSRELLARPEEPAQAIAERGERFDLRLRHRTIGRGGANASHAQTYHIVICWRPLKVHILSDVHLRQERLEPPVTDADAVILAGDIARPAEAIAWAREFGKPVIYVAGNHEFYEGSIAQTHGELERLSAGTQVHVLNDGEVVLDGVRFLGATLWTDFLLLGEGEARTEAMRDAQALVRDFKLIRLDAASPSLFTPEDAAALFAAHAAWLRDRLAQPHHGPTVVVTHHAPSPRSIHARFEGSPLNPCYVSHSEHLLDGRRVRLWVHGHTHDSFDYVVNGTRVVCNPRGYARGAINENSRFDPKLVVDLE